MASDPRKALIFGIIGIAVLMLGGIIWAVVFLPSSSGNAAGKYDANASFNDSNDPVLGPANAKVTLRLFEDFECPACKQSLQGVDYVKKTYADRIKIVWNDFPLDGIHQNAHLAANAARCAEDQGKFWEYADALYGAQDVWTPQADPSNSFVAYAKQLGLNDGSFAQCLAERTYDSKVADDVKEGVANRVDATPTFFLNNVRLTGALTQDQWDTEIQKALKGS
jgi:protein-disulfide isomerase